MASIRGIVFLLSVGLAACVSARLEYGRVMKLQPDAAHGQVLYDSCARCHDAPDGNRLYGKIPRLDGQHDTVLIKEIVDYRRGKRWSDAMEDIAAPHDLSPQSVADVAAYASRIPRRPAPSWTRPAAQEPGAVIYAERCLECHGVNGAGDARKVVPRIGGQHYEYLVWQFYDIQNGHRQNLPSVHRKRLSRLSVDDILDVADFLARASPAAQQSSKP